MDPTLIATIQLISAIVQAIAAVVLVAITWWYAKLTSRLARTAADQMEFLERKSIESAERDTRSLTADLKRVQSMLLEFPLVATEERVDNRMRTATLWDQTTVSSITRRGLQLLVLSDSEAAELAEAMTWMVQRLRDVRKVNAGRGFDYDLLTWEEWTERMQSARRIVETATSALAGAATLAAARQTVRLPNE